MKITRFTFVIVVLAGVVSCQFTPNQPQDTRKDCGAAQLQALVGLPQAEVDFSDHAGKLRIIGPNDAYTEDHRPSRLNIFKDAQGTITKITCG